MENAIRDMTLRYTIKDRKSGEYLKNDGNLTNKVDEANLYKSLDDCRLYATNYLGYPYNVELIELRKLVGEFND